MKKLLKFLCGRIFITGLLLLLQAVWLGVFFWKLAAYSVWLNAAFTLLSLLIALLTAVTIVIGMKMIGSIMISAFIVFPALAAMRLCKHFRSTILLSAGLSAGSFVLGLFFAAVTGISFGGGERIDLPIGPCVVAFNILALLVCILISKVRGRRKKSKVHAENAAA